MKHTYIGKSFFICLKLLFSSAAHGFTCLSLRALFQRNATLYGNGPTEGLEKTMWNSGKAIFSLRVCRAVHMEARGHTCRRHLVLYTTWLPWMILCLSVDKGQEPLSPEPFSTSPHF